ncbi:MAG TPA: MogA/MoaB family molybdenum cofactor biosynthesis protein [Holophagaceae bacterium]|jgi:molybdenum cofactor synthesis domain-containing protein|nr:MogA/MoaB family molybdenum cofactor biosynthesis protein [Holophagaceae bacterium]
MDRVFLITLSDRASAGVYEDKATPLLKAWLGEQGAIVGSRLLPDGLEALVPALKEAIASDEPLILTCGGTGFGPRDLTPEATRQVVEREAPGIAEFIRAKGGHPMAFVSRAVCGIAGRSVILNLSGKPSGAMEQLQLAWPLLKHAVATLRKEPEPQSPCG